MNNYIEEILKLSKKAYKKKNIPVGAIVVFNNKIIGKGYNKRYQQCDVTNHAEIIAIKKAAKKIKDWRLNDCELYVTLKPCSMCEEIIKASRIKKVYYLLDKDNIKKEYSKTIISKIDVNEEFVLDYQKMFTDFFKDNGLRK